MSPAEVRTLAYGDTRQKHPAETRRLRLIRSGTSAGRRLPDIHVAHRCRRPAWSAWSDRLPGVEFTGRTEADVIDAARFFAERSPITSSPSARPTPPVAGGHPAAAAAGVPLPLTVPPPTTPDLAVDPDPAAGRASLPITTS